MDVPSARVDPGAPGPGVRLRGDALHQASKTPRRQFRETSAVAAALSRAMIPPRQESLHYARIESVRSQSYPASSESGKRRSCGKTSCRHEGRRSTRLRCRAGHRRQNQNPPGASPTPERHRRWPGLPASMWRARRPRNRAPENTRPYPSAPSPSDSHVAEPGRVVLKKGLILPQRVHGSIVRPLAADQVSRTSGRVIAHHQDVAASYILVVQQPLHFGERQAVTVDAEGFGEHDVAGLPALRRCPHSGESGDSAGRGTVAARWYPRRAGPFPAWRAGCGHTHNAQSPWFHLLRRNVRRKAMPYFRHHSRIGRR